MTDVCVRVQRITLPAGRESWTVLAAGTFVDPAERFLAHLVDVERSPNTVRAYAHDLRDYFEYLEVKGLQWDQVRLEDIGRFVAWLRLPRNARGGPVALLPSIEGSVTAATVNRKLSALGSFYEFHRRHGVELGDLMARWTTGTRRGGSWQPFLVHLGDRPERTRTIKLKAGRPLPQALSEDDERRLVEACNSQRDQLLLSVMRRGGLRVGEALGLRHEDLNARRGEVAIVARDNANGARAKTWNRVVPVEASVIRLYSDYLHEEYGTLDSDYVFVLLHGETAGWPMTYAAVDRMVRKLRCRTGVHFTPQLASPQLCHRPVAPRGPHRGRSQAARPRLDQHNRRHLQPLGGRRHPPGAGCRGPAGERRSVTVAMAVPAQKAAPWVDRVRSELRPEFDTAVILAAAGGQVFTGQRCSVPDCDRSAVAKRLCGSHVRRWEQDGKPPIQAGC